MQADLLVRTGAAPERRLPIAADAVTLVGRAIACSVILDHHDVAPIHCLLASEGDGCVLIDAWARAGTKVNGGPFAKGRIGLGDVVAVGPFELELVPARGPRPDPAAPKGDPLFEFRSRRDGGVVFAVSAGSCVVLGRHERADVQLRDAYVSDFHLAVVLAATGDEWLPMAVDLRSSNGTSINGRPIHRAYALPGSVLTIGSTALTVCRAGGASAVDESAGSGGRHSTEVLFPGVPGSRLVVAPHDTQRLDAVGYADFFGFDELPFRLTADPDCFFRGRSHARALVSLFGWLRQGLPVGVLHGPAGTGKSLLAACVVRELAYRRPAPVVVQPGLEDWTADELIAATLARAGEIHGGCSADQQAPLERWQTEIDELRQRNVLVALVVDDADTAAQGFVGQLAELLGTESARTATRVLLVGRDSVVELAESAQLAPLVGIRCELAALEPDEVAAYIGHRLLGASGRRERLFTRQAVDLIAEHTGGIPRLINTVADAALFAASRAGQHTIGHHIVADALRDALDTDAPADRAC